MKDSNLRSLWEQRLAEQASSEQSIAAWCREQSIHVKPSNIWN